MSIEDELKCKTVLSDHQYTENFGRWNFSKQFIQKLNE